MPLSDTTRLQVATFAKEAARRHFLNCNAAATDEDAMRFAMRFWRADEFLNAGVECAALAAAIDEATAAPFN
jgi:hypothetical protein